MIGITLITTTQLIGGKGDQTNMKPFDLQKALDGEPVVTRDGRMVKIAGYNKDAFELSRVAGWVIGEYGVGCWGPDGMVHGVDECNLDLFMADPEPVIKEGWVNVYRGKYQPWTTGGVCQTEAEARKQALDDTYITTTKIQWPEKP